jgi:putative transposase
MTDPMMSFRSLLENTPDADLVCEMLRFGARRLMELEVEALTGAAHGERSADRINQRNGYRREGLGNPRRYGRTPHPEAA